MGPDGNVYVVDRENGRIQWFTPEGDYLGQWHLGGRVLGLVFSIDGELYVSAEPKFLEFISGGAGKGGPNRGRSRI